MVLNLLTMLNALYAAELISSLHLLRLAGHNRHSCADVGQCTAAVRSRHAYIAHKRTMTFGGRLHRLCEAYLKYCVKVRKLGEGERDTERGPASPPPAKKPSLLKRAYDLTMGNPTDSTVSSANSSARSAFAELRICCVVWLGYVKLSMAFHCTACSSC